MALCDITGQFIKCTSFFVCQRLVYLHGDCYSNLLIYFILEKCITLNTVHSYRKSLYGYTLQFKQYICIILKFCIKVSRDIIGREQCNRTPPCNGYQPAMWGTNELDIQWQWSNALENKNISDALQARNKYTRSSLEAVK